MEYSELIKRYKEEMSQQCNCPIENIKNIGYWQLLNRYSTEPVSFVDMLKPFQIDIYSRCVERIEDNKREPDKYPKGGGISVPMGGGKTIISLVLAVETCPYKPILIVCSKSLIGSWISEIEKFFGDISQVCIYHDDYIKKVDNYIPSANIKIVITTPEVTRKFYKKDEIEKELITKRTVNEGKFGEHEVIDYNFINDIKQVNDIIYSVNWGVIIVDEFHRYNNVTTDGCRSLLSIVADSYWALSGTLFSEPKTEKILSYYRFIRDPSFPNNLPDARDELRSSDFGGTNESLIAITSLPFDIVTHINHVKVSFTREEEKLYLIIRDVIIEVQDNILLLKGFGGNAGQIKILNGSLLAMLTYLRQLLVCPLVPLASLALTVFELKTNGETNFVAVKFMDKIREAGLTSYLNNPDNVMSSRFKKVLEITQKHSKIIIFTEFRSIIDAFMNIVKQRIGRKILTLDGGMNIKEREKVINECRNSDDFILILTYKIGACGLNLQFADTVILVDYTWNSSDSKQSIARCSRQGQTRAVNVYFLSSNTGIENAVLGKHMDKLRMCEELEIGCIVDTKIDTIHMADIVAILKSEVVDEKMQHLYLSPQKK